MRFELALLRPDVAGDPTQRTEPARKAIRVVTDRMLHDALRVDDLPGLVTLAAETMCVVAETLLAFGIEPDVADLVEAAQALVEDSRAVMDRGLLLRSFETVRCGAVMMELTVRGLCATLSVPYDAVLVEVRRAGLAGEAPAVRPILIAAGLLAAPEVDRSPESPGDKTADLQGAANEG